MWGACCRSSRSSRLQAWSFCRPGGQYPEAPSSSPLFHPVVLVLPLWWCPEALVSPELARLDQEILSDGGGSCGRKMSPSQIWPHEGERAGWLKPVDDQQGAWARPCKGHRLLLVRMERCSGIQVTGASFLELRMASLELGDTLALSPHGQRLGLLPTEGPAEVHALGKGRCLPLTGPVARQEWRLRPGLLSCRTRSLGLRPPEACSQKHPFLLSYFLKQEAAVPEGWAVIRNQGATLGGGLSPA